MTPLPIIRDVAVFTLASIAALIVTGLIDLIPTPNLALQIASYALQAIGWGLSSLCLGLALLSLPWGPIAAKLRDRAAK